MATLCSIAQAKAHLRIDTSDDDTDLTLKLTQASAIVLDYLKSRADAGWTDTVPPSVAVPGPVEAATLILLSNLYEHRGDDMAPDAHVWAAVERLLIRYRDPALA